MVKNKKLLGKSMCCTCSYKQDSDGNGEIAIACDLCSPYTGEYYSKIYFGINCTKCYYRKTCEHLTAKE